MGPCGPMPGVVVAEVELQGDGGETLFLSLAEFEGIPNMYRTPASVFEKHFENPVDESFFEELNKKYYIPDFGCSYGEFFGCSDHELFDEWRYLVYIVRSDWDEIDRFKKATVGKWIDEIEIPKCDIEEEWEEDTEE